MHPELIPGFPVKTYGCCMAIGFLCAWQIVGWLCRRTGRDPNALGNLLVSLMVAGVAGSRLAYVIEHWQAEFAAHPLNVIRIDQGGLMFYGGLILAMAVFAIWCVVKRERPLALADVLGAAIPLAHAFGRIGCFFYGCCYGRRAEGFFAVAFPNGSPAWHEQLRAGAIGPAAPHSLPVLPTQLFEAAALLVLFGILLTVFLTRLAPRKLPPRAPGLVAGLYLCGYALVRFGVEFLRGDPRAEIGPFSISQTISFATFAAGALILLLRRVRFAAHPPAAPSPEREDRT